jgi:hypothetical protein
MSAFSYSLDDSSGEALGDGLDSGALDLSGADWTFDDTLQGSSLDLGGVGDTGGVTDYNTLENEFNLSGVSDPIASDSLDSGEWDTNGAGSAASTHPLVSSSSASDNVSTFLGGISKFGASIGQLFARGGASAQPTYAGTPVNANPNKPLVNGVSSGNALLLVGLVVIVGAVVVLGGNNV